MGDDGRPIGSNAGPVGPAPETVTEAVAYLRTQGYTDDIELEDGSMSCSRTQATYAINDVVVDHTFRFEGDSDPGDEAIVLGLRYPDGEGPGRAHKATLVSAFGPAADQATTEFFARLRQT